ncbi:uncharacterized protein LOC101453612 [Ceratitis capitata]|uniref:uncharacterized protein LOC101453612 n=1 Tax=Ceratitis capitata TaxID=7213 RepID=UPI000C6C6028|nr:uncharacterized protein LOC101453612 [Ceratitis capitata]
MSVMEGAYWTVRIFPAQTIVQRRFALDYNNMFPKHLANMQGQPLRIYAKAWYPQIYTFTPAKGNSTLSGFLGRALLEYAKVHNATIEYPLTLHRKFYTYSEFYDFFENKTIDIGSLTPIEVTDRNVSFSVVFHRIDWCLMVPMEQPLLKSRIYYSIIQKTVIILFSVCLMLTSCLWAFIMRWQSEQPPSLIEHFFNVSLFQGLLGMPFRMKRRISGVHKIICLTISLASVLIVTAYITYLQSFSVNTPITGQLETIADLLNAGIKLAISREELSLIHNNWEYRKYIRNFTVFDNFTEFLILRDSLDTGYAFTVTDMWTIYDEQQKYFSRPLFRLSDICFSRNYPMVLPLQESSVHRHHLNGFLARLHEAGLINHWTRHSFYELLQMDWIFLKDPNQHHGFKPLKLEDLNEILVAMGILFTLCVLCFVFEYFGATINKITRLAVRIVKRRKYKK